MTNLADKIDALAEKATPGPWRVGSQFGAPENHITEWRDQ